MSQGQAAAYELRGCSTVRQQIQSVISADMVLGLDCGYCRDFVARPLPKTGPGSNKYVVWQCALCNNQFRIEARKAAGGYEEFIPFSDMFQHRVHSIGNIVALITPWNDPEIHKRVWCNYEICG